MSEFNDGGLAERGGGGLANPGGPNTAGGGGGQANRSGIGLGVNSGRGWANNPYSNNRNPWGVMAGYNRPDMTGLTPDDIARRRAVIQGVPIPAPPRRNPVTGELEYVDPRLLGEYGDYWGYHPGWASQIGLPGAGQWSNMNSFPGEPNWGGTPGNWSTGGDSGIAGQDPVGQEPNASLMSMSSLAADPNASSGMRTMAGPGQGLPGRMQPMVNPGPIGPGGQPGTDPRNAQLLAFHQAIQDWKAQRPQDRNDMAAWEAWRNSRPDRPDFGRPRPRMSRPPRVAEQRPAPRPRGFQIGGDLALRHMYNR